MLCGLGEEERTKFRKKKKEKKEKNIFAAKGGLVGMEGCLKTYVQPYDIFFAVLKPFLTETAFYAKLAEQFSCPETKVT